MYIDETVKELLEKKYKQYNQSAFIKDDPISLPHRFSLKQDIEIVAFWVSILAWGQRKTIINKGKELISYMDNAPYDFVRGFQPSDLRPFLSFKHRTFNDTDTLYFLNFFQWYYTHFDSLEQAFKVEKGESNVQNALIRFEQLFFSLDQVPHRTRKHIASPAKKSTCKRLNMFLRWMVRQDSQGVDFGLWSRYIHPKYLLCPLDVHVDRVARQLNLIHRRQNDWKTVLELSDNLRQIDKEDPVKYDFALFGMGLELKKPY